MTKTELNGYKDYLFKTLSDHRKYQFAESLAPKTSKSSSAPGSRSFEKKVNKRSYVHLAALGTVW